jgi:hypothetical protein
MRKLLFFLFALFVIHGSYSQDVTRQWLNFTYEALDSKASRLNISQLLRWRDTNFNQAITEADFKTELFGNFSGGMELRYILDIDREGAVQGNRSGGRIRLNLFHKTEFGRWDVSQRVGIQYYRRFDDGANRLTFRFRPEITPNIRRFKHDPSFSVEYFKDLESGSGASFRYGLAVPFDFDKNRFELGYYLEQAGNSNLGNEHIFVLRYKRKS